MKNKILTFIFTISMIFISLTIYANDAVKFFHSYKQGEKYKIITEVYENVYLNNRFSHKSNIRNKIAVFTEKVKNSSGRLQCVFQTSEAFFSSKYSAPYVLKQKYYSAFSRDSYGKINILPKYYMPVIRNVPFFLKKKIRVGEMWTKMGIEVHDLRRGYRIKEALRFPIHVNYTLLSLKTYNGEKYGTLLIQYNVFHAINKVYRTGRPYPVKITGQSKKKMIWNITEGKMDSSYENFDFIFHLSNGATIEFKGYARSRLIKSIKMNKIALREKLKKQFKKYGVEGSIAITDKGVKMILDSIKFSAYSSRLQKTEINKLKRIGNILRSFNENDILISGHTARSGNERTSKILSQKRAQSVAGFFIKNRILQRKNIVIKGFGSSRPVAPNNNETNMKKNRRVEITILEN